MDDLDQKILSDIEMYGCNVMSVFDPKEVLPDFTYSIGITKSSGAPEVIVIGLNNELSKSIVNNYNKRVRSGEVFEAGKLYEDFLEGFSVCFEVVDKKNYKEYVGYNLWLYGGNDFDLLQLIWPTTKGIWPWEEAASAWIKRNQPMLGNTPSIKNIYEVLFVSSRNR